MNCDKCAWYVRRELKEIEKDWLRQHPGHLIDARFCTLGGCDGGLFRAASGEEEQDNEQTGMQAGIPAAQAGDGGGDKQEGSAEGGGDLQAEAIRSSERPAETEENR